MSVSVAPTDGLLTEPVLKRLALCRSAAQDPKPTQSNDLAQLVARRLPFAAY
jgi:hypothetical protein